MFKYHFHKMFHNFKDAVHKIKMHILELKKKMNAIKTVANRDRSNDDSYRLRVNENTKFLLIFKHISISD